MWYNEIVHLTSLTKQCLSLLNNEHFHEIKYNAVLLE